ncbi:hypothetical protein [Streptomyces sp. NPDC059828]|uniref:hypothetical protein n=1 Tax=Streptomyces sp. NPDC059828 TaxID=3346965 RepID=UPI00365537E1
MGGYVGWIVVIAVMALPIVIGLTRETGHFRRVTRADRAMRELATAPGWELHDRSAGRWSGYVYHFPLVDGLPARVLHGSYEGHEVTVARLQRLEQRRGLHWLSVSYRLPRRYPMLRLERDWSAAHTGLPVPGNALYVPIASDVDAVVGPMESARLPQRLLALGAPAVSLGGDEILFLYHPMPDVPDLPALIAQLATLLPDVLGVTELLREDPAAPEDAS